MKSHKNVIPVFFAVDNNYAPYLSVAISSIKQNASREYAYDFYILNTDLSDEYAARLFKLASEGFGVKFVNVTDALKSLGGKLKLRDYYTCTTYYRLFIADMFPSLNKALYLDSDITVLGDISELYNTDLGNNLVGAITDETVASEPIFRRYAQESLGIAPQNYFNAGILLMNLNLMRKENFFDSFAALLNKYKFAVAQDQDYLNVLCRNRVAYIGGEWNKMPITNDGGTPKLIHYNLTRKPWHYKNVIYREYFWQYAALSDFYDEIQAEYTGYTVSRALADAECEKRLIALALSEVNNAANYYKKFIA